MAVLTDEAIQEIRERAERAAAAPSGAHVHDRLALPDPRVVDEIMGWDITDGDHAQDYPEAPFRGTFARLADAKFFLAARADVLALCDEAEETLRRAVKAESEIQRLREVVRSLRGGPVP